MPSMIKAVPPPCPVCNTPASSEISRILSGPDRSFTLYACRSCDLAFVDPLTTDREIAEMYASGVYREEDGRRFMGPLEKLVAMFREIAANRIHRLAPVGRLLDIGCGRGHFLNLMKQRGWDVSGTELCPDLARSIESAYGIRVSPYPDLPDGSVDMITMNHVLEHLNRPVAFLAECNRMLKPGGVLVVAVPNYASWQSRFGGKGWFHLDVPHHLFHFGASGLVRLLKRAGFRTVRTRNLDIEQGVFGWLQTLLNRLGFAHNALYLFLRRQPVAGDGFSRAASLLLAPVLTPLAVLLTFAEAWCGDGAVVEVVCRKVECPEEGAGEETK